MPAIYWQQVPVVQEVWDTFVKRALQLVKKTRTGKIDLELEKPTFRKNVFAFSGKSSPSQQFYVSKDIELDQKKGDIGWNYCETNNEPYTTDIFICLILMYDLGMLQWFSVGDEDHDTYQGALEDVQKKYALKNSYAKLVRIGNGDEDVDAISMPRQKAMKPRTKKAKSAKKAKAVKGTKKA